MRVRTDALRYGTLAVLLFSVGACESSKSTVSGSNPPADGPTTHGEALSMPAPALNDGTRADLCERACAHTAPLACSAHAECAASCTELRKSVQACAPKLETFMRCVVSRPLTDFECDDDGVASVKEGPCDHEQGAVAQCLVSTAAEG